MSKRYELAYEVAYEVAATSEWEALQKAAAMLRESVYLTRVRRAERLTPGWWKVTLIVSEDS